MCITSAPKSSNWAMNMVKGVSRIFFIRGRFHFQIVEYLIIAKERLILASAPYAPMRAFFIRDIINMLFRISYQHASSMIEKKSAPGGHEVN